MSVCIFTAPLAKGNVFPLHEVNIRTLQAYRSCSKAQSWIGRRCEKIDHKLISQVCHALQETVDCTDESAGSSDEDQQSSRCDISSICVEELSQTARHVTRQVQLNHHKKYIFNLNKQGNKSNKIF